MLQSLEAQRLVFEIWEMSHKHAVKPPVKFQSEMTF